MVRAELADCVLLHQPDFSFPPAGGAYRLRFAAGEVDERIEAVRAWFRERGRAEFTWWVGTSATPANLEERLLGAGAAPWEDGVITMMTCTEAPPETEGVEVRRVGRFEDFVLAREIAWGSAELTEEQAREARATLPGRWEERLRADHAAAYIAYIGGEPVAAADLVFLPFAAFLSGASTKPGYRGRGAFRPRTLERGCAPQNADAGRRCRAHVTSDSGADRLRGGRRAAHPARPL
jgi:hypothetical protein